MEERDSAGPVALILAGGGARGAYEAGALSVLLPVLEQRGELPRIVIGTSVGALNAAFIAANVHRPMADLSARAVETWEATNWHSVARSVISLASVRRLFEYAGEVLNVPEMRIDSVLDPQPLRKTVHERVDFEQIKRNVADGRLDAAGVVATSALTARSVVFHTGLPSPPPDPSRGIDYVATPLAEDHVLASASIPGAFPAVHVEDPESARGWYYDGGTRLNTPIKPALALGARRVVVVALNPLTPGPARLAGDQQPDVFAAAGQILLSLLGDQLVADVHTVAKINGLVGSGGASRDPREIPYIAVAPAGENSIGQRALDVIREHYGGPLHAMRSLDISLLTRLTAGDLDVQHAELLSFLLFVPEFAKALVRLGRQDAQRWIDGPHDFDDLWQVGPV
ncbi:MAG TPA: patatin-like phospholipase family protein [Solirubrobacteraceae bacterium]|jgi:NTE family protein